MNDRAVSLLEQYDIEVQNTKKARGAFLCETNLGTLIFKEYNGNQERLSVQNRLLTSIESAGHIWAEHIMTNKEGSLLVQDMDGTRYILKTYREGRECNIADRQECLEAVRLLARLHEGTRVERLPGDYIPVFSPTKEYEKRNRELKRVRKYLKQRSQKSLFEIHLLQCFDTFYEQALKVSEGWKDYEAEYQQWNLDSGADSSYYTCCHGDYQYHNILFDGREWFMINFEKWVVDNPIRDLFLLLRKLLEKNKWSLELGRELILAYEKEQPISSISRIDLYYRLSYPEKFWKIVNFYYHSGKAWIPEKNLEKLEKLLNQEQEKKHFLEEAFRI